MPTTPNRGYPYPAETDPGSANLAAGLEALADAIDTDMQALYDSLTSRPLAIVTATIGQDIPNGGSPGTLTEVVYDRVDFDNAGMVNLSTASSRITPTKPGLYLIYGSAMLPKPTSNTTAYDAFIRQTGADFGRTLYRGTALSAPRVTASGLALFDGHSDYVTFTLSQTSGATVQANTARMMAMRVASLP